jgi:hypothetical protein
MKDKSNLEVSQKDFENVFRLDPIRIFSCLMAVIMFLLLANIVGIIATYYFHHGLCYGLVPMFDFSTEKNIPTFYSSFALLLAGILLGFIALLHKKVGKNYLLWCGLMLIFFFLALDEFAGIHERFDKPAETLIEQSKIFSTSKVMFYPWVIPYVMGLGVVIIAYWKFLFKLPRKTMILFIISGVIFVSGAVGVETISGYYHSLYGYKNLTYALLYTLEETLEMSGIALFIYTLLQYIAVEFKAFSVVLHKSSDTES